MLILLLLMAISSSAFAPLRLRIPLMLCRCNTGSIRRFSKSLESSTALASSSESAKSWSASSATSSSSSAAAAATVVSVSEIQLPCADGVTLAAQKWEMKADNNNDDNGTDSDEAQHRHQILCIHGWLDNCRSFHSLAPDLVRLVGGKDVQVVALDMPGHGWSDHKQGNAPPMIPSESIFYVAEALEALGWKRRRLRQDGTTTTTTQTLVGHSLGAAISALYSASYPEDVDRLVLIDGAGFVPRNASDVPVHVRKHVDARRRGIPETQRRIYPNLDSAVKTRLQSMKQFPGNQTLSYEAALELVQRNSVRVPLTTASVENTHGVQFRHDARYSWPSLMYYTLEQNEGIFAAVKCPTCWITAENGWPISQRERQRLLELLRPTLQTVLPGSHYLHADPVSAPLVAKTVADWIVSSVETQE